MATTYICPRDGAGIMEFAAFLLRATASSAAIAGSLSFIVIGSNNDLLSRLVHIAFCIAFYRDTILVFPIAMTLFVLPPRTMLHRIYEMM